MNIRHLPLVILSAVTFSLGSGLRLSAAAPAVKPGYTVVLDVHVDEKGLPVDAKVARSDDPSIEHILEQISMEEAHGQKFAVRMKDGHAVKYLVREPFEFPVEGDEGPDSNLAPKPSLHGKAEVQPVYPPDLAAKGETGGAIVEITIGADGGVRYVNLLRASQPEFGEAAMAAVKQWQFSPAMRDNVAVSSRWRVAVVFETDVQEPGWQWRVAPRPELGSYTVLHRTKPLPPPAAAAPAVPTLPAEPGK
jgi:TonB family protein